jgi:dUTP pyrophosphatase
MEMFHDRPRFELISKFADEPNLLPTRATKNSAGYDFVVAQDTIVPSYQKIFNLVDEISLLANFNEMSELTKKYNCRPTLVPTGVKAYLPEGYYL